MALGIASEKGRKKKPWERDPWVIKGDERAGVKSRVLPLEYRVLDSAPRNRDNGMTAAGLEAPNQSVPDPDDSYKSIDQVVEKTHAGFFGNVYDVAAHGLSYAAGKAVSLVPQPARKALVPVGLSASLLAILAIAYSDSGPKAAYASDVIRVERKQQAKGNYDPATGILTIPLDYVSNADGPVEGIVKVKYNGKIIATSEPHTLNPGRGDADFKVKFSGLLSGTYTFGIEVVTLKPEDGYTNNNETEVAVNATPTAINPSTAQTLENKVPEATEVTATAAPLADLVFGNVKHTAGEWGEDYKDGKRAYRVEFDVSNSGNIGSGAFYVSVSGLEQKLRFDGIGSGKSLPVAVGLRLLSGKNSIDFVIEAENKANEKDGNNKHNLVIDVPEPPFEFDFPSGTDEQKAEFLKNALEDYRHVLKVYGTDEKDARLKINIYLETYPNGSSAQRYGIRFFQDGKSGSATGMSIDDFTADRREVRHEIAHAKNHTSYPAKNDLEPWYNTFNEGSAKYASGEIEDAKPTSTLLREDDGSIKNYNWMVAIELAASNPSRFWERVDSPDNAGWLTGQVLYLLLEREGLTPEKNVVAMKKLAEYYKKPDAKTNREMIRDSYQFALGKNLDSLFNSLEIGIKRFYPTPSLTPTPLPR